MPKKLKHRPGALLSILFAATSLVAVVFAAIAAVVTAFSIELSVSRAQLEPHRSSAEFAKELKLAKVMVRASTALNHVSSLLLGEAHEQIDSYGANSLLHLAFYEAPYEAQAVQRTQAQIAALGLLSRGEAISPLAVSTTKDLEKILALESTLTRLAQEEGKATRRSLVLVDRYNLIARDFADLISLPPLEPQADRFPFYQEGVLKGLPGLQGLPDNIPDLVTLRTLLEKLKANVKVEGSDAATVFAQKIAELRADGTTLIEEVNQSKQESSDANAQIDNITKELRARRIHARANLRAIFLALVGRNPLDPHEEHLTFSNLQAVKQKLLRASSAT